MGFGFDFKPDDIINRHVRVNKAGRLSKVQGNDKCETHDETSDLRSNDKCEGCGEHHDTEKALWVSDQMPFAIVSPAVNVQTPEVRFVIGALTQLQAVKELHKVGHFTDEERKEIGQALKIMRRVHNAAAMRKIEATGGDAAQLRVEPLCEDDNDD